MTVRYVVHDELPQVAVILGGTAAGNETAETSVLCWLTQTHFRGTVRHDLSAPTGLHLTFSSGSWNQPIDTELVEVAVLELQDNTRFRIHVN